MLQNNQFDLGMWEDLLPEIEDESFDLIYTDPPYGMSYRSTIPGHQKWNKSGISTRFPKKLFGDSKNGVAWSCFSGEAYRLLKNDCFLFLHCNLEVVYRHIHHFEDRGFNIKGQIVWDKSFSIGGDLKLTTGDFSC
jgi:DNA modification methylase